MTRISKGLVVRGQGPLIRAMYCPDCDRISWFMLRFIAAERTERGHFVWFRRECTGRAFPRPFKITRGDRDCVFFEQTDLSLYQWDFLADGKYQ